MHWTRPLGLLVAAGITLAAIGSLISLMDPLAGEYGTVSAAVLALVAVSVLAMVALGAGSTSPRDSAGYW